MAFPIRPIAFVLASSNHGAMIVNRNDQRMVSESNGFGVGYQILNRSSFDETEVGLAMALLDCRRRHYGNGVFAIDGGANIGVHTLEWARHMHGWGTVLAFEAQEVVYYALAGNIVLNNLLNARARLAALGEQRGELPIPQPDYFKPASFGSLEMRQSTRNEFIGQAISYAEADCSNVPMVNLDSLCLRRLDFLKLDVEGMEVEVLRGGREIITRQRPIMLVEIIKSDRAAIDAFLTELGYRTFAIGINLLAIHDDDPTLGQIQLTGDRLTLVQ
jgi:FkbM family methyltransferase